MGVAEPVESGVANRADVVANAARMASIGAFRGCMTPVGWSTVCRVDPTAGEIP